MAERVELRGDYDKDWPVIQKAHEDMINNMRTDNMNGETLEFTFPDLTEQTIPHKLERKPTRYTIQSMDDNATFKTGTVFTDKNIFLTSDKAGVKAKIFVE